MSIRSVDASLSASLKDFFCDPLKLASLSNSLPIAIFHEDQPLGYFLSPEAWRLLQESPVWPRVTNGGGKRKMLLMSKKNDFLWLSNQLLEHEHARVRRKELSSTSLAILRNRLQAQILPFFRAIDPTSINAEFLDQFVIHLSDCGFASTTISQYLVIVRKLCKLAVKVELLPEVPEFPVVRVVNRPRSMLSLSDYASLVRTAYRLVREQVRAPQVKVKESGRSRFWLAARYLQMGPDLAWAIRFMVNSFVRPGDLRQLQHKHVQVCRGEHLYLRLTLPETKRHYSPMVTLRPAVHVYERILRRAREMDLAGPEDYVFLPQEKDRDHALAVLGFWFKWVLRASGVSSLDELGRARTLYSLRHTSIMFRLLYGQGIDMLTLARNARTSVQMIDRFYASALAGEMNVAMLQSRRSVHKPRRVASD